MSRQPLSRILKGIALWVPTVLMAMLFVMQGIFKLQPNSPWPQMFKNWGFPAGSVLIVGAIELLAGIALLVPRIAAYAAATLALVMLGAAATHLLHAEWLQFSFTLALSGIFTALARVRMPRRWKAGGGTPGIT